MARGILKNARTDSGDHGDVDDDGDGELDRALVIANTRANAAMHGERVQDGEGEPETEPEHPPHDPLRWDERNLLVNEREKSATMKIDEPKTPYEGGFDPQNEYYRDDDDDDDEEDAFVLGAGADDEEAEVEDVPARPSCPSSPASPASPASPPASPGLSFEERRRAHYAHKADVLRRK